MPRVFLKITNPKLRKTSIEISQSKITSKKISNIVQKMLRIAKGERGNPKKPIMVGLAAPQIGISKRIILVDAKADGKGEIGKLQVYINPKITWCSKKTTTWYEGCFSIPEVCGVLKRPSLIKIQAFTFNGEFILEKHSGYIARIFQHEIDHLDGKFFVDLINNPNNLHLVKPEDFPLYRNKKMWKNWPKKAPFPLALRKLKQV